METQLTIRKASSFDLDGVVSLFSAYRAFYGIQEDLLACEDFLTERFKNNDTTIFIAATDNQIVGFVHLFPSFTIYTLQRLFILNDLFIAEPFRGKGISKLLIQAAKEFCIAQNARGLFLETGHENKVAQKLYLSEGFQLQTDVGFYLWLAGK